MNNASERPELIPPGVLCLADYAREAAHLIDPSTWAWLEGGSGDETALGAASQAYRRHAILNRVLVDCAAGSTRTQLFGTDLAHPVILAPLGYHRLVHPEGEVATARGALDTVMAVSTMATMPVEQIAAEAAGPLWFQLYFQPDRADTASLLARAERAGCGAILVTLDAPVQPAGLAAIRSEFRVPETMAPVHVQGFAEPRPHPGNWSNPALDALTAAAPSFADVLWLRAQTNLPLIAKGVTRADDAARLLDAGWNGIVLSTHGGRTLDCAPAPLDRLAQMRAALGTDATILIDGGIRTGSDIFKALALGANAVMVGRPQLHGLAVAGSLGVAHMLKLLREELEVTMVLAGCPTIASITADALCTVGGRDISC
jgi:4-hydroxymandelate oxidase